MSSRHHAARFGRLANHRASRATCSARLSKSISAPAAGNGCGSKYQSSVNEAEPPGGMLALQRQLESFPFFEFCKTAFTVRSVGLVIALLMIAHEGHNVLRFPFRIRQAP